MDKRCAYIVVGLLSLGFSTGARADNLIGESNHLVKMHTNRRTLLADECTARLFHVESALYRMKLECQVGIYAMDFSLTKSKGFDGIKFTGPLMGITPRGDFTAAPTATRLVLREGKSRSDRVRWELEITEGDRDAANRGQLLMGGLVSAPSQP